MAVYRLCVLFVALSVFLLEVSEAQESPLQCMSKFTQGKNDFVLDTDESVKEGATFLASPQVSTVTECVTACCRDPNCNLALMESIKDEGGAITACFTFNCLYKQKPVCRFVRKTGFKNHVLTSVFGSYLKDYVPTEEDKPPKAIAGQDRVIQPNEVVTLNGIESKDDHKIVEYKWTMVSGNPSAVIEKSNFPDQVTVSQLTAGVYKFRLTVVDNAGQSDSTEITVLVLTPEQTRHHCLVPKKTGPCRGAFPRWHYNAASEKCEEFTFGGCKENRNNYLSREECLTACDKVSVLNPPSSGRHGPIDVPSEQCGVPCGPEKFTCANGCCIDKELECDQTKECSDGSDEEQCDKLGTKFRRLLDIPVDVDKARCTQPPVTGPCRASFTKWYYNPYDRKCNRFNFGGCQGNENQFEAEDHCMKVCTGVNENDVYVRRAAFEKQTGDGNAASIGIAVALGLAILVLVAVIGYCMLKGKKQPKHQRVAVNGAHSFPIEDTEKLVYNSTTKPI